MVYSLRRDVKTQGLRAAAAVGMVALLLLAGGAVAHAGNRPEPELSLELDNRNPIPSDEIEMTIHFALPDGCYDIDRGQPEMDTNNIQVRITAVEVTGPCPGPTDETLHRIVGPLPPGDYSIGALLHVDYLCNDGTCQSRGRGRAIPIRVAPVGDANCDATINSIDANYVLQQSAGLLSSTPCPQGADANRDGNVQSIDATLILQYGAGLLAQLPPG